MRQNATRFGLTAAIAVLASLSASALTVEIQLDKANINLQKYAFHITQEDRDGMKQYSVTVSPKKDKLSPGLLARLHVSDGKTDLALVPVEETREGGKVTYWFRAAPNLLAKTRFEFNVLSGTEIKDQDGKIRFVAIPGTIIYWLYIGDFTMPNAAPKVAANHNSLTRN